MISKPTKARKSAPADIYSLDIETDSKGAVLDIGFYDGADCRYFDNWETFTDHLNTIETPAQIYAHNGGGFDYVNYLIWLFKNGIHFNAMLKQSKIFCFYLESHPHIKFVDSFCLLPTSLEKIAKSFSELDKIEIDNSHYKNMRAFKDTQTKTYYQYLERDCVTLYDAIIKLKALVNEIYDLGNLPLSIGSLSMRLFTKKFLTEKITTPSEKEKEFTFRAYVGGRCEYLGFGIKDKNGWYANTNGYDFNSHYPTQMIVNQYPIRRGVYTKKFLYDSQGEIESGIYEATFRQGAGRFPILKDEIGDYTFNGAGVYTHIELNEILRGGGTVELIGGYHYDDIENIFSAYVDFFFNERLNAQHIGDDARDTLYKLVLNNLYGKFGQRDDIESLQIYSETDAREKMNSAIINEFYRIDDEFCFYEVKETKKCFTSFPAIACMITAAGRVSLCRLLEQCKNPIYCDTDSIHCQNEIDHALIGDNLGQLKIEFLNSSARYGGKKSYEILDQKVRQKGIPKAHVNTDFFNALFADGKHQVTFQRPLLLKSAIRHLDISPSEFRDFTRTITLEKSFFEKSLCE